MFFICQILSFNTLCNIKYYKEYYAMKYIKTFNHSSEYDNFINSGELITPNISFVRESGYVSFHLHEEEEVGESTYDEYYGTIPPESTSFKFPLYITIPPTGANSDVIEDAGMIQYYRYYRTEWNEITKKLFEWFFDNAEIIYQDEEVVEYQIDNPNIYINGYRPEYMYSYVINGVRTDIEIYGLLKDEDEEYGYSECWLNKSQSMTLTVIYYREIPISTIVEGVGDIAYWDGSSVKTCTVDTWNTSLGTPIGVVVIPEGFAPDGKARLISLKGVDINGNQSDSQVSMKWGPVGTDTSLTNYDRVPTTDNAGSTSTGSDSIGHLPSNIFAWSQSYVDPEAKYDGSTPYIPSPYLGDGPNPEYYKTISGYNNALSDFNGLSNTQTLVGLGSDYEAARACWNYKDGASNLQWYLPAMGELGYLMPKIILINASLTAVGGVAVSGSYRFWSSSEYSSNLAYYLYTNNGYVYNYFKDYDRYVRPFCSL